MRTRSLELEFRRLIFRYPVPDARCPMPGTSSELSLTPLWTAFGGALEERDLTLVVGVVLQ